MRGMMVAVTAALALGGCESAVEPKEKEHQLGCVAGLMTGAVIGGVLGGAMGAGEGAEVGKAIGGAAGAVEGTKLTCSD